MELWYVYILKKNKSSVVNVFLHWTDLCEQYPNLKGQIETFLDKKWSPPLSSISDAEMKITKEVFGEEVINTLVEKKIVRDQASRLELEKKRKAAEKGAWKRNFDVV